MRGEESVFLLTDFDAIVLHFDAFSNTVRTIVFVVLSALVPLRWDARNRCSRKSADENNWSVIKTKSPAFVMHAGGNSAMISQSPSVR